ncbi:MAG: hypothetical protein ACKOQM_01930 [Novosphingobium sp.]
MSFKSKVFNRLFAANRVSLASMTVIGLLAAPALISAQDLPPSFAPLTTASNNTLAFSGWFVGGNPGALNAAVKPADSVNFSNTPNQDFYRWSYQMFLWLTSPSNSTYGGSGRVFSSPEFYSVSPPDPVTGERTLTRNPIGPSIGGGVGMSQDNATLRTARPDPTPLGLRVANLGPNGFPFIRTKDGKFREVVPLAKSSNGLPMVRVATGRSFELSRARIVGTKGHRMLDISGVGGRSLKNAKFQPSGRFTALFGARKKTPSRLALKNFVLKLDTAASARLGLGKHPILLLPNGTIIDSEVAQSDGSVQLTQSKSLVYYGIAVNDVFAYYLTGQKNGDFSFGHFPVSQGEIDTVSQYASSHGHTITNPNALAVEIKTSWVDVSAVSNPAEYITMQARVPNYDTSDPEHWTRNPTNPTKVITVAMVGMHVVGTAAGHPEMIWATFEHVGNAPNVGYTYKPSSLNPSQTQPADQIGPGTNWLFAGNTIDSLPFQAKAIDGGSDDIVSGITGQPISGASVQRLAPWGAPNNHSPNPLVTLPVSNSEIISLIADIRSQMNPADVRSFYLFNGATWTIGGASPTTNFNTNFGQNIVGTNHLANTTMETFTQSDVFVSGQFPGPGCLSCHDTNDEFTSHVFGSSKKLF